ncbi:MAG: hypothetical protein ACK6AZ_02295, partial [Pseudanabaena sp.]
GSPFLKMLKIVRSCLHCKAIAAIGDEVLCPSCKQKPEVVLGVKPPQLIFWFYVLSKTWFAIELL